MGGAGSAMRQSQAQEIWTERSHRHRHGRITVRWTGVDIVDAARPDVMDFDDCLLVSCPNKVCVSRWVREEATGLGIALVFSTLSSVPNQTLPLSTVMVSADGCVCGGIW